MFKNILEKRKRFTIPMAVATASKSHFHEINNIIQFFLEFFFFSVEKMKKINHKNPQRVGANFDRKRETSDDW